MKSIDRLEPLAYLVVILLATLSCAHLIRPNYDAPSANEPHAVIKIRRVYETQVGTTLSESFLIDNKNALSTSRESSSASTPETDGLLVHPKAAAFVFSSSFTHTETRMVTESYTENTTEYVTESYNCGGFGSNSSYRTCTRSVPKTHSTTKFRTVPRVVSVTDGSCGKSLFFTPQRNKTYLLQFTYQENKLCSLSCFLQKPGDEESTFENTPCPGTE